MMDSTHTSAPELRVGRPFEPGHDPRRNAGGRPQELARRVRAAVADGAELVEFFAAVFRGDTGRLGVHHVSLRDRIEAGEWLAHRGWGRPPLVVEPSEDETQATDEVVIDAMVGLIRSMPEPIREQVIGWLEQRRRDRLEREVEQARAEMAAMVMPSLPAEVEPPG